MTRADKILLAALLLFTLLSAGALYGRFLHVPDHAKPSQAVVTVQGKVARRIELAPGTKSSFVVDGRVGPSAVEVDGTRVRMAEAPCAAGTCVKQGWIAHPGQSVVCIPGEIMIRIEGAAPLDAVTR